tara:strand:+ start:5450 stop:6550 length:1101 start_codon:yes stop_codon:yes gene_type:complete
MIKKVLSIIGTRPEAIKMAPMIKELNESDLIDHKLCITSQHKEALMEVVNFFNLEVNYDLDIMKENQSLFDVTINILSKLEKVLEIEKPDMVLVHGDTTTSFVASLASFYKKIMIGHVEAGLRTYKKFEPFPEEINRKLVDSICDFYYAPTQLAKENLINEGVNQKKIFVTGNTVVDAVELCLDRIEEKSLSFINEFQKVKNKKNILLTTHRRENFGKPLENICDAIIEISDNETYHIFCPVHPNPNVKNYIYERFQNKKNITLLDPLKYPEFLFLMSKSDIIISDSGGVQEEAPSLNKKVIILRNFTERPEGLNSGHLFIAGTEKKSIIEVFNKILSSKPIVGKNPYGDGDASKKIRSHIESLNV